MKKSYDVTFIVTTNVTVDVPKNFNPNDYNLFNEKEAEAFGTIIGEARRNILEDPLNYLYGDNAEINEWV